MASQLTAPPTAASQPVFFRWESADPSGEVLWGPQRAQLSCQVVCLLAFSPPPPRLTLGGGPNTSLQPQEGLSPPAWPTLEQARIEDLTPPLSRVAGDLLLSMGMAVGPLP